MLWDKGSVLPVKPSGERHALAFVLTASADLFARLTLALDLAGIRIVSFQDVETCAAAIPCERPDIVLVDERLAVNRLNLRDKLADVRTTETLPVLPIQSDNSDATVPYSLGPDSDVTEIFLKVRALLRRERPAALYGRRHSGSLVLDEPQFRLFLADRHADLSKTELCLLGPFFDVQGGQLDRQSLEELTANLCDKKLGPRNIDFQLSRLRRRLKVQLGIDPLQSIRGVGYILSGV
jgi:two-component system phosphate regulon response regulator PhoB